MKLLVPVLCWLTIAVVLALTLPTIVSTALISAFAGFVLRTYLLHRATESCDRCRDYAKMAAGT